MKKTNKQTNEEINNIIDKYLENNEVNNGTENENKQNTSEENPKTYDGITTWIILGLVSMSGIVGTIVYRKKKNI